ncbi:predicted protein [Scheffersomyces stipitis CBS 6054]|uniref:Uncharacterized protein n=1 Tax=Scheffersomyces stipitis (strain ATCC 58785 / CBS 6054 / NBRC 10063 / NRRL Y-11545) TaxID=322104 RepID=A3LZD8_PICST|nr:predicted protein [Scheffersomyces stipitis CBS 6054]ABN68140.1 predicted protein [Scheffersomyces stipitis CBS 6054]
MSLIFPVFSNLSQSSDFAEQESSLYPLKEKILPTPGYPRIFFFNTMEHKPHNMVLPPANGKKLWRVKRTVSGSHGSHTSTNDANDTQTDSSLECLNNSLKIAAAAGKFSMRRPPLRRPKNKPGKPKDFVFVDLSPVKTEDSEASSGEYSTTSSPTLVNTQLPSPTLSINDANIKLDYTTNNDTINSTVSKAGLEMAPLNESFNNSISSEDDSLFSSFNNSEILESALSAYMQVQPQVSMVPRSAPVDSYGLGIMNMGSMNWDQPQVMKQQQTVQMSPQQQANQKTLTEQLFGYQQAMLQQYQQIQLLQQQLQQQQEMQKNIISPQSSPEEPVEIETKIANSNKRSKSTGDVGSSAKRRASGQFQFKTYTGPNKSKQQIRHRHTVSEPIKKNSASKKEVENAAAVSIPTTPKQEQTQSQQSSIKSTVGLEDFMMLNEQISIELPYEELSTDDALSMKSGKYDTYSPVSDYSDEDDYFAKSKGLDPNLLSNCGIDQYLIPRADDFVFSGFAM